jgi:hypothetical protein
VLLFEMEKEGGHGEGKKVGRGSWVTLCGH